MHAADQARQRLGRSQSEVKSATRATTGLEEAFVFRGFGEKIARYGEAGGLSFPRLSVAVTQIDAITFRCFSGIGMICEIWPPPRGLVAGIF